MELLIILTIAGACAYHRATTLIWGPVMAIGILSVSWYGHPTHMTILLSWLIFYASLAFSFATTLRRKILITPLLGYIKKILPPMSETEKIALNAGDVWFEGDIFRGEFNSQALMKMPIHELSKEEMSFLDNEVETLCALVDEWKTTQQLDLDKAVWESAKALGFFGLVIPKEFGGKAFSPLMQSCVVTKLATRSIALAVSVMVPNSLGPGELLSVYGTQKQKEYYLPRLARGEEIPCFCLTGPEAGSDAGSLTDTGVICKGMYQGQEIIGIKLNFNKRYITLAPVATLIGLAFKLSDPEHLLGDVTEYGISLCLISRHETGLEIGARHCPLNTGFMNGPVSGKDVFVPLDAIIGGKDYMGQGWRMLMESLAVGRAISLPALATAIGQVSSRTSSAYASVRRQFKLPIGKFEGVQEAMAIVGGCTYGLQATRIFTANALNLVQRPSLASAIAKYNMTEMGREVINAAMDIHGGKGIQMGPTNYLASLYIATPVMITVEGANILTRNLIIFGQGAMRAHPYIRSEMEAAAEADQNLAVAKLDNVLMQHVSYTLRNAARSLFDALIVTRFKSILTSDTNQKYEYQIARMSSALAFVSDIAMVILGGELKRKESISARLGDVLSQLYIAAATLKHFHQGGSIGNEQAFVDWNVQRALYKTQEAFYGVFANFPVPGVGAICRLLVFPFGRSYSLPSDKTNAKIADAMMNDTLIRTRLSEECYLSNNGGNPIAIVEAAYQEQLKTVIIVKKVMSGIKAGVLSQHADVHSLYTEAKQKNLINDLELKSLEKAEAARQKAIAVDDFAFEYFNVNRFDNEERK